MHPSIDFLRWFIFQLLEHFDVDQERNRIVLLGRVTHYIKGAHESEHWLESPLGDEPVLLEEVQRQDTSDVFTPKTHGQVGVSIFLVESAVCVFLIVSLDNLELR